MRQLYVDNCCHFNQQNERKCSFLKALIPEFRKTFQLCLSSFKKRLRQIWSIFYICYSTGLAVYNVTLGDIILNAENKQPQTHNIYTNLNIFIDNTKTFTGFPKWNLLKQGYEFNILTKKSKVNLFCTNEVEDFKVSLLVVNSMLQITSISIFFF